MNAPRQTQNHSATSQAGDHEEAEVKRLRQADEEGVPWRRWGPYLSDRQWGTVREDYSDSGDAWSYFSHDQARSRAYRWGEDGIAGFSDDQQLLCLALALWNGKDPILKERLFGLTNSEGNHGEDVKEYYFYLDATPTHSYQRFLYKYPHAAFPYNDLVETNRARNRDELEYELLDSGVFSEDRYFDVTVEYAKAAADDILMRVTVANRGPEIAEIDVLPTVWFRNTWTSDGAGDIAPRPSLKREGAAVVMARHPLIGVWRVEATADAELLFTDNDTNTERCGAPPTSAAMSKTGSTITSSRDNTTGSTPNNRGRKWRPSTTSSLPPVARRTSICASGPSRRPELQPTAPTPSSRRDGPRPTSFTPRSRLRASTPTKLR